MALGGDLTDNANALRMAGVKDESSDDLNALTASEFYRRIVTNIVQNLMNQQSEISGVDINQEAAEILIYEQMFQAMAKYMSTIHASMASLMQVV